MQKAIASGVLPDEPMLITDVESERLMGREPRTYNAWSYFPRWRLFNSISIMRVARARLGR